MDWAINGVRLLGLALFAAWEYVIFRQRYTTRKRELRAKQIEGAAAVMRALAALYTTTQHQPPAAPHELQALYAEAVAVHTQWIAFLPGKLDTAIADFLKLFAGGAASPGSATDPTFQRQVQRGYVELVTRVRQTLGIEPLGPEALVVLEQPYERPTR